MMHFSYLSNAFFIFIFLPPGDVTQESLKEPIQNLARNPNRRYSIVLSYIVVLQFIKEVLP